MILAYTAAAPDGPDSPALDIHRICLVHPPCPRLFHLSQLFPAQSFHHLFQSPGITGEVLRVPGVGPGQCFHSLFYFCPFGPTHNLFQSYVCSESKSLSQRPPTGSILKPFLGILGRRSTLHAVRKAATYTLDGLPSALVHSGV